MEETSSYLTSAKTLKINLYLASGSTTIPSSMNEKEKMQPMNYSAKFWIIDSGPTDSDSSIA
jgi:hypothetical protein